MSSLARRFADLRPAIDNATHDALVHILDEIGTGAGADDFVDAAIAATRSGKRFRGLLAHLGAALASGAPLGDSPLLPLSAALELYQASALVHDDLIDHADTRRGAPTPHIRLARLHRDSGWTGSARAFGEGAAILVGDLLFSAAEHAIGEQIAALAPERGLALLSRYTRMHAEVALGQYLDVRAEHLPLDLEDSPGVEEAMEVVERKSARYSIVHPTLLGAIAAGAPEPLLGVLDEVLTPWGIAFQLRDDDLGVFGDPATTGKPAGDDLLEGKRTVLLALAWTRADLDEHRALARVLGEPGAAPDEVAEAAAIIARRGRPAHETLIDSLIAEGAAALEGAALPESARADLLELSEILTARAR